MYRYLYTIYSKSAESIEFVFGKKFRDMASASSLSLMIGETNFFTSSGSILLSSQTIMDEDITNFDDISSKLSDDVISQLKGLDLSLKTSYVTREIVQDD